ncbi:MAG: four helix bundle protein [Bacteroidetes bacterium]|nr:four helix bundle protein [Bacteroidota bacterium]
MKQDNIIKTKSFDFAVRIVNLYKHFIQNGKEYVMCKQLLRSGTSIGANIREAINAESNADFIHKYAIAQKECNETLYWLELLFATDFMNEKEFLSMKTDAEEIMKILTKIIVTSKAKK